MAVSNLNLSFFVVITLICEVFTYAQHPGAYSSPHYAKKSALYSHQYDQPSPYNEPEYQKISQQELQNQNVRQPNAERSKHHEMNIPDLKKFETHSKKYESVANFKTKTRDTLTDQYQNGEIGNNDLVGNSVNESQSGRSAGLMETAGNFLNGRGGQMLADIARELISRSTGASSQVLSLNLTNLVILVVLKALILAAGMFGAGAWNQGYARSLDSASNAVTLQEGELSLWQGYLQGGSEEGAACLAKAACSSPGLAKQYASGADILLTAAKLFKGVVPYDENYEAVLEEVKQAAIWGAAGLQCSERYPCSKHI